MADLRKHSSTSNLIRFTLKHATTGVGLTGLSSASSGLIISTIADNEATATTYTVAGSTIETIATLGTFAAPTATKCRFKEVDATNHKGLYEFQFADARFSVANAKRLIVSVTGAANLLDADYEIQLVTVDLYDVGFSRAIRAIGYGTVTTGATTTSIPTSAFSVSLADANQLNGRVLIFAGDSSGAGTPLQASIISASTTGATPTFTLSPALTQAPASGSTFIVQ